MALPTKRTHQPWTLAFLLTASFWLQLAHAQADSTPHKVQMVAVEPGVQLEVLDWGGSGRPLIFLAGALRAEDLAHPAILPQPTVIIRQITWAMMWSR